MTTAAMLLILASVRETRTVRTDDTSVCDDLLVECDDSAEEQIGLDADDAPVYGTRYWGAIDGSEWQVVVSA